MAAGCGGKCAKIMLIIFNLIFWLAGAALLGVGIWLLVDPNIKTILDFVNLDQDENGKLLKYAIYVIIAVGGFMFIVGFFGCCGAIKENKCMLAIYIVCLLIVMGGEIAAGVLGILKKDEILDKLKKEFVNKLQSDYGSSEKNATARDVFTLGMDVSQLYFECCGVEGPDDYKTAKGWKAKGSQTAPWSCYPSKSTKSHEQKTSGDVDLTKTPHKDGCQGKVEKWMTKHSVILIGVALGVAALELFGFIFALCLCRNVEKDGK